MKRAVVVLLLLIANAVFGSNAITPPNTAPGRLLREWLTAYNASDLAALTRFAEERCTADGRGGLRRATVGSTTAQGAAEYIAPRLL